MSEHLNCTLEEINSRVDYHRSEIVRLQELAVHLQAVLGPATVAGKTKPQRLSPAEKLAEFTELPGPPAPRRRGRPPGLKNKTKRKPAKVEVPKVAARRGRPPRRTIAAPSRPLDAVTPEANGKAEPKPVVTPTGRITLMELANATGKKNALERAREEVEAIKEKINKAMKRGESTRDLENELEAALQRLENIREGKS